MRKIFKSGRFKTTYLPITTALVIAIAGTILLLHSHAATPVTSVEAETGSVVSPATTVTDSNASNGSAVQFNASGSGGGSSSGAGPCNTVSSVEPDATNTGVPAGTTLTTVNGSVTVTQNGTVINGEDIKGFLIIKASNVTVENSLIEGLATSATTAAVDIVSGTGTLLKYDTVAVNPPSVDVDGVWGQNFTADHLNISGGVDGMKPTSNVTVENSYIHDLTFFNSDPNQGGGSTHNDGIQTLDGTNLCIENNYLLSNTQDNSAIQITQDFGAVGNVTIFNNWANGGQCTINISQKGSTTPPANISVIDNRIGHESFFNCPILIGTIVTITNSGNVWLDAPNTGQTVSVQQHD